jgi:hypothetical protein
MTISPPFSATSSMSFRHLALNSEALMVRGAFGLLAGVAIVSRTFFAELRILMVTFYLLEFISVSCHQTLMNHTVEVVGGWMDVGIVSIVSAAYEGRVRKRLGTNRPADGSPDHCRS